jgi:hypothetical protein
VTVTSFPAVNFFGLVLCTLVNEAIAVVKGAVRLTFHVEIAVRFASFTDDRNAGFDPSIYNGHPCIGGSLRNGNDKRFAVLAPYTAKHLLSIIRMACV